jgi:DNA-directed RNA polymerase specialized sigma24 family protein
MAPLHGRRAREELVAREALALRATLLRVHAHRALDVDLEDIYSQAVIELLLRARRDPTLATRAHVRNALRQKLEGRISDHRRAIAGRSAAAAGRATALPLDAFCESLANDEDTAASALARVELREILGASKALSADQRAALASVAAGEHPRACCQRKGWSIDKYRKLVQRGRARLRAQLAAASATPPDSGQITSASRATTAQGPLLGQRRCQSERPGCLAA